LQGFSGRKVVLTQGIAELGKKSAELNYQTGRLLAQVADLVLLTGVNAPHIEKGLLNSGFDKTAIKHYASLAAAQSDFERVLQKGDIFLLQNDLIDIS
jgi:UDP-N-acetylmuramoyl-tripeptide--D-alanyl-D-alanine ligase